MKLITVILIQCALMMDISQSVFHNLMMYAQDSAETFGSVWSQVDGINDIGVDNKSITELLSGGNFRAKIQDSWGTPVECRLMQHFTTHDTQSSDWKLNDPLGFNLQQRGHCLSVGICLTFVLVLYSSRGYVMGEIVFEMSYVDPNNLTEWFDRASMYWWDPQPVSKKYISMNASDGELELLVTDTNSGKAWFVIVHNSNHLNPAIVLARNSSSISMNATVTEVLYEGCFPDFEVTASFKYEDVTSMTVESCFLACSGSGHDHVGMQNGSKCYCATLTSMDGNAQATCTLTCGGDVSQNCGGTTSEYLAVYSGIVKLADIDNLVNSTADNLLINHTRTNELHFNTTIYIWYHLDWDTIYGYVYVNAISITAIRDDGNYTSYWFNFTTEFDSDLYADQMGDYALEFPADGTVIPIDALPIEEIRVHFNEPVMDSTVLLYGPHESYVYVPYLILEGDFDESTVTTTSSSTTTSDTTSTSTDTSTATSSSSTSSTTSSSTTSTTTTSPDTSSQSTTSTDTSTATSSSSTSSTTSSTITSTTTTTDTSSQSVTPTGTPSFSTPETTTSISTDTSTQTSTSSGTLSQSTGTTTSTGTSSTYSSSQSTTTSSTQTSTSSTTSSDSSTQSTWLTSTSPSVSTTSSITLSTLLDAASSQTTTKKPQQQILGLATQTSTSSGTLSQSTGTTTSTGTSSTYSSSQSTTTSSTQISTSSTRSSDSSTHSTWLTSTSPSVSTTSSINLSTLLDAAPSQTATENSQQHILGSVTTLIPATTCSSTSVTFSNITGQRITYCSPYDTLPIVLNGSYYCPCATVPWRRVQNNRKTLQEVVEEIVAELTVDKTSVSAYTRKYTSADDRRPTAQTLGSVGVIILAAVVGSIIYIDSASLIREIGRLRHNYKHLKRRLSRKSLKVDALENSEVQNEPTSIAPSSSNDEALPTVSA